MKYIGIHTDSTPDLSTAPLQAAALGARAFAFNAMDPSRWKSAPLDEDVAARFRDNCALHGFTARQVLPHAAFVINLGSPDARKLKLSRMAMTDEMTRVRMLGLDRLNFHPGAHLKQMSEDDCLTRIAESINIVLDSTEGVTAVIENTAGQGSNLGYSLEQIARIIEGVKDQSRVGVCIDTAHGYAAGYDIASPEGYDSMWADFDRLIGFGKLRGLHLNDSMRPLGSRIDRHAPIGLGEIGADAFDRLMLDPRIDEIPCILETPDPARWQEEVAHLQSLIENNYK